MAGGLGALRSCGFLTGLLNLLRGRLPGGVGAVVHAKRIEVASASARVAVRAGAKSARRPYLCPELICLPRDPDREARAFATLPTPDTVAAGAECLRPG